MTSISTVYSTTQLTYSVAEISADTRSALTTTSSQLAAGLANSADQQDQYIAKAQQFLALARLLNSMSIASAGSVSLLGSDSASAAALASQLQSIGVTDLPPQCTLVYQDYWYKPMTVGWLTSAEIQALGSPDNDSNYWINTIPRQFAAYIPADSLLPTDSGDNTVEACSYEDYSTEGTYFVIPGVTNRLVTSDQLIEWANVAIGNAATISAQMESGNSKLQGQLDVYVSAVGRTYDLQQISDKFIRDRDDSQLKNDTDYRAAVREVVGRPSSSNTKTST